MTHIAEISVGRIDLGTIVFVERHAPETVILGLSCYAELFPEYV